MEVLLRVSIFGVGAKLSVTDGSRILGTVVILAVERDLSTAMPRAESGAFVRTATLCTVPVTHFVVESPSLLSIRLEGL